MNNGILSAFIFCIGLACLVLLFLAGYGLLNVFNDPGIIGRFAADIASGFNEACQ